MNPPTSCPHACPGHDRLRQLLDSDLSGGEEAELVQHLDSCSGCQQSLEEIAGGASFPATVVLSGDEKPEATSAYWPIVEQLEREAGAPLSTPRPPSERDLSLAFLTPSDDPHYVGKLGQFEVESVIGRGGMGVVMRAFDPCLQRYVAVKVLDPQFARDSVARKRFCREARAAAAITHENVVAVHQVEREEEKDLPFLVMQLISGTSLEDRLQREGRLPLREIVRIGMQTAAGLAAAHAQGLIHRDIKPANILLEDGAGAVKLTDFGLAKAVEDVKLTATGFISGTPLYMAPEQAKGDVVDHRADLFSLGSVLYEMCTGRPPFEGNTPFVVLRRVTEEIPRPIREVNPDVPGWLVAIIDKLHAKNPDDRFQTAAEVGEVLGQFHAILHSSDKTSLPKCPEASRTWTAAPPWYARKLVVFLAGALVGGGAVSLLWALHGANVAPQAAPSGPEPTAVLSGNAGPVWSAAFAPDGRTLAMGSDDGTVKLWDVKDVQVRTTLNAHHGPVWSLAYSPDGALIATASDDGLAKVWDAVHGKELASFKHPTAVRSVAFAPDGKRLATGSRDGGVRLWDVASHRETVTTTGHKRTVTAVAFAPDGKTVASASGDKTVKLWDAETGQERLTLQGHTGSVYAVAFSRDSKTLASGGWDKTVRLWDCASGDNIRTLTGHGQDVWSVAFAPDGQTLTSVGEDQTVKVWSTATGKELATLHGHTSTLYTVAFARDGKTLASGGRDGTVRLWDAPGGE